MLENAIYSILSPEGYSSILWKDPSRYKEAAEKMKLTAENLYELKVIDKVINEPSGEIEDSFRKTANQLKKEITSSISKMKKLSKEEIKQDRYLKFRKMGDFKQI